MSLQSDKGTEFKNKEFQMFLRSNQIHLFTTENPETKASIVERFQRTLKSRMWKYFTYHQTRKYIDVLPDIVDGYNNTYHRSIRRTPISVNKSNEIEVTQALYGTKQSKQSKNKLNVGDLVRINKTKRTFEKGYLPNWTKELFKIVHIIKSLPLTFKIEDLDGEKIEGSFYGNELQCIKDDEIYEIESVLAHRTRRVGNKTIKEIKVHWLGYPSKFDSWIPRANVV